jgi:hypothetical protein
VDLALYSIPQQTGHPQDMGEAEVEAFLPHLAFNGNVAASTPN